MYHLCQVCCSLNERIPQLGNLTHKKGRGREVKGQKQISISFRIYPLWRTYLYRLGTLLLQNTSMNKKTSANGKLAQKKGVAQKSKITDPKFLHFAYQPLCGSYLYRIIDWVLIFTEYSHTKKKQLSTCLPSYPDRQMGRQTATSGNDNISPVWIRLRNESIG